MNIHKFKYPNIIQFEESNWVKGASRHILTAITNVLAKKETCSVMLTGGASAALLYGEMAQTVEFSAFKGISFYIGDERIVPFDHEDSNFGMIMKNLFPLGVQNECGIFKINVEELDPQCAALAYAGLLPEVLDILIIGVGVDGHIASLFPNSEAIDESEKKLVVVCSPNHPHMRITITPPVIGTANKTIVLAPNSFKRSILKAALSRPLAKNHIPACFVLDADWIVTS
jgi:6-phosphogluconolactonase